MNLKNFSYPSRCIFGALSFSLSQNSKVLIFGDNGIGKTSFVHALSYPSPEAKFDFDINQNQIFLSSYSQTNSFLSVENALKIIFEKKHVIDHFQINDLMKKPLKNLSSGQLQKFWLTIAFNQECELLILDEPTIYLDFHARKHLQALIQNYSKSVFVISHELEFFKSCLDQILYLKQGSNQIYLMKDFENLGIL